MKEYGSDFHYVSQSGSCAGDSIGAFFPSANYYADGRQALIALVGAHGWKRVWVPSFFCYDVLSSWKAFGVSIIFYEDSPCSDDVASISTLPFQEGDVLLRVNYYGLRSFRSNRDIPVPVVEDHTHSLIGDWAVGSDADWCIASLRKSLPIAEGGILWSPRGLNLPERPGRLPQNEEIAVRRWNGMRLKTDYLAGMSIEKSFFRKEFLETEPYFDVAPVSAIDSQTEDYLSSFCVRAWYHQKRINWLALQGIFSNRFQILKPENLECFPFSLSIVCDSADNRELLRQHLIENSIYPAVLWNIPSGASVSEFTRVLSSRVLSIHCDGRYSVDEVEKMKEIIESVL